MILVEDNYAINPQLFKTVAVDKQEYYHLLRGIVERALRSVFDSKDVATKAYQLGVLSAALAPIREALKSVPSFCDASYHNRVVVEPLITDYSIKYVEDYGREHDYPKVVLKQKDHKAVKSIGPGKEAWDQAIAWAGLKGPYNEGFKDLIQAISFV